MNSPIKLLHPNTKKIISNANLCSDLHLTIESSICADRKFIFDIRI